MNQETSLIELERFCSKAWRIYGKEDPLSLLSFNEFDYLRVVQAFPEGIRITDLADEMKVTKPSASNMVVRLEKKGLVKRISCIEDARSKKVVLTENAIQDMSLEQVVYKEVAEVMNSKLSEQEVEQLVSLLKKSLST